MASESQHLEIVLTLSQVGIVNKTFGKKAMDMFRTFEDKTTDANSDSEESDAEGTDDSEDEPDEPDDDAMIESDEEEDDVMVKRHTRSFPTALVEKINIVALVPFKVFEPARNQLLVSVFESRRINPKKTFRSTYRGAEMFLWTFTELPIPTTSLIFVKP